MATITISDSATVLFQVFGDRDTLRAAPLALVDKGKLGPLTLDAAGWRTLDSGFFATARLMPIYRNGLDAGTIEVMRGMWPADGDALYSLPGCRNVVPQALVKLTTRPRTEESLEFLASSRPLKQGTDARAVPGDAKSRAKPLADSVAAAEGVGTEELDHLEFIARWLRTGAGPNGLTLLASYIDPEAGDAGPGAGHTSMVLVLAEDSARTVLTTYHHVASGESRTVEFQRLVNHADLDGDGVDEIILEVWHYAGVPELAILKRSGGRWAQAFRVSENWCLDRAAAGAPR